MLKFLCEKHQARGFLVIFVLESLTNKNHGVDSDPNISSALGQLLADVKDPKLSECYEQKRYQDDEEDNVSLNKPDIIELL